MSFNKPLFEEKVVIGLKMLGLEYEQTQLDLLSMFSAEFFKWNSVHNLSSIHDENEYLSAHIMDSLGAINPILKVVELGFLSKDPKIVDLGVGGGFPGMVLAIFLPEFRFSLIDAVRKKTVFLNHVVGRLKLKNVNIFEQRIEHFAHQYPNAFDVTISRAFTELSAFVNYSRPLLHEGGVMFAMKSQKISEEIIALSESEKIILMEDLKIPFLDAYRCILAIQSMRKFSI
jgi:16S rRNA (guanine527-N7)-methyltransferase